MSPMGWTKAEV